ncbi:MAG: hypothetical protein GVY30_05015 [Chloroflexi bacterium]|jgi:hypothetical protein|nr:hypothetical protein [Chloroflexota bacterium]
MSESNNKQSLIDWFGPIMALLGIFTTLVTFIGEANTIIATPEKLRAASMAGFFIFLMSILWIAFKSPKLKRKLRWPSLILLYLVTMLYAAWVGTWLCKQPLKVDSTEFPIEKGTVSAYLYQGIEEPGVDQGKGYMTVYSSLSEGGYHTAYDLYYQMGQDGEAYAGIALQFQEPQDLTAYNYIELTISFGDQQSRCELFIKDGFGGKNSVVLGDGKFVEAQREAQTVRIPLETYFPSISRKLVREIDLNVNNYLVTGDHSFRVSDIKFTK